MARPGGPAGGRAAGPAARRLARERGVDLRRARGSGRGGRITVEDVRRAARPPADALPADTLPADSAPVTARADLSALLDRLPALAAVSGQDDPPLAPLLIKAAAAALRACPELAPLSIARGAERWALADGSTVAGLGIAALTRAAAAARITAPAGRGAAAAKTALRMDGPVTEAAYRNGAIHAGAHLRLTLQGPEDAACAPFLRTLVQLLETPVLLLSA